MPNYLSKEPISSNFEQTYVSQFVPLPLAQFARANEKNQAIQDNQVAQASQTSDALWKINPVDANDKQYTDALRNGFDDAARSLSTKDLTQKDNQAQVKGLIKNTTRDPTLNGIIAVASAHAQYEQNKSDMIKTNNYKEYNDVAGQSFADYSAKGGYKSGIRPTSDIFKYEDSEPTRKQYFDDMQKLGSETVHRVDDQWYKNGEDGISEARIGKQAHAAIYSYMGTTAAAQDGREYDLMLRQSNPKNLTKNGELVGNDGKPMSRSKYILDKFITTGMERAGISTTTGRAQAKTDNAKNKQGDFSFGTLQTQGQNTVATGGYTFDDGDYDKSGSFTGSGKTMAEAWKSNASVGSAISDYFTSKTFNTIDPKDQRKALLGAAARLNGMSDKEYVNTKAGPDAKITTTFHSIPTKQQPAANQQFYDMQRNAGVFNNMPVMDLTTGKQGSMVEILRQLSEAGQLKNKKNEVIKLSDNPTIAEAQQALEGGIAIVGKQDPNHYSAKSYVANIGGRNIAIDMTYGGTQLRDVPKEDLEKAEYQKLKVSPIIEGEGNKAVIKWYNERTFKGKDGNTYKAGSTYATPLSEINTIR